MAHQRKLGRPTDQRRAMLRNLTTSLLESGKIQTTYTRAKEVQKLADKMVTLGKTNTLHTKRTGSRLHHKARSCIKVV